jgi:uncharacterized membrane protein
VVTISLVLFCIGAAIGYSVSTHVPILVSAIVLTLGGVLTAIVNVAVASVADGLDKIVDDARTLRSGDYARLVASADRRRRGFIRALHLVYVGAGLSTTVGLILLAVDLYRDQDARGLVPPAIAIGLGGLLAAIPPVIFTQGVFRSLTAFRAEIAQKVESEQRRREALREMQNA